MHRGAAAAGLLLCVLDGAQGFTPAIRIASRPRSSVWTLRSTTISASISDESEIERLQAELAKLKAGTASLQDGAPPVASNAPAPTLQEPSAQAIQEPALQAFQEPAAQAIQEPAAAVAPAAADALQGIQDSVTAAVEVEPTQTATIALDDAYPLLVFLGLSIIPLAFSVAKALNPELFAVDDPAAGGTGGSESGKRDAKEIFFTGLDNLKQKPLGWFFGEPSALYSNVAPPTPAPAPMPAPMPAPPTPSPMPAAQADVSPAAPLPPLEAPAANPAAPDDAAPTEGSSNRYEKRRSKKAKKKKKGKGRS